MTLKMKMRLNLIDLVNHCIRRHQDDDDSDGETEYESVDDPNFNVLQYVTEWEIEDMHEDPCIWVEYKGKGKFNFYDIHRKFFELLKRTLEYDGVLTDEIFSLYKKDEYHKLKKNGTIKWYLYLYSHRTKCATDGIDRIYKEVNHEIERINRIFGKK